MATGSKTIRVPVVLGFSADTSKARQQVQNLITQLNNISTGKNINISSAGLEKASTAALQLQQHLLAAVNVDTGKLDLGKFNASLNSANHSLDSLSRDLLSVGAEGQKAFVGLAQSIASAQAPVFQLNGAVERLWNSLKGVATWQLSSAALQAMSSAISDAYQYTKDLNKSLNDIRIVTGYNIDHMEKFADKANKAAKALSTTTNEYTKASLIYFQQGLTDSEVQKRTDLTIKMANVTGQSVEKVSDQLTAVWNNFADGAYNLEKYVDVMTALGAATASSSEEISEGLNKFAAVADTVGLSYNYAASALATVTATTRQSADVVGTAFKTLFARIQDLELGKTLDDGTTMGQYSQALASVGINIKDTNGQLKDMDAILEEMGAKWSTLSKDSQVALAQNVAGIRQYTQLIALMDNWDFFQENLQVAKTSAGTLQQQADIYAESWEAAQSRVDAALEGLYDKILDDDFFIDLLDGLANIIEGAENFIDTMGGIGPIIASLAGTFVNLFSHKIQPAISNALASLRAFTAAGAAKEAEKVTAKMNNLIDSNLDSSRFNYAEQTQLNNAKTMLGLKQQLWNQQGKMTEAEKAAAEVALSVISTMQDKIALTSEEIVKLGEQLSKEQSILQEKELQLMKQKEIAAEEDKLRAKVDSTREVYEKHKAILDGHKKLIAEAADELAFLEKQMTRADPNSVEYGEYERQAELKRREMKKLQGELGASARWMNDNEGGPKGGYQQAMRDLRAFEEANQNAAQTAASLGERMIEIYKKMAEEAAAAGQEMVSAFNQGEMTADVSGLADDFFANNKDMFDKIGDGSQYSVKNPKAALNSFREQLGGESVLSKMELSDEQKTQFGANNMNDLFNSAENAKSGEELKIIVQQIQEAFHGATMSAKELEDGIRGMADENTDDAKKLEEGINKIKKPMKELEEKYEEINEQQEQLNKNVKKFQPKHMMSFSEGLMKIGGAATSAVTAFSGLVSLVQEFNENGFPDTAEEWASTLMTLTFVAPQLYSSMKSLVEVGQGWYGALKSSAEATKYNNALMATEFAVRDANNNQIDTITGKQLYLNAVEAAGADATEEQVKAKLQEMSVSMGLCAAKDSEAFSEEILNGAKQRGTILSRMQTAANNGSVIAKVALAAAQKLGIVVTNAETGAVALNAAAWYAHPIMWIALIIIAVIAAIVALVVVISNWSDAMEQDRIAAEKANEALQNQIALTTELKGKYDELKDSIDSYTESQKKIDTMVKGTREWREAVLESNKAVMELVSQYPSLRQFMSSINGRLEISDEGLERLQDAQLDSLAFSYASQYAAQIKANSANARADRTDFINDHLDTYDSGDWFETTAEYTAKGTMMSGFNVIGSLVGAIVGISEATQRDVENIQNTQDVLDEMSTMYYEATLTSENYNDTVQQLIGADEELTNALIENKDSILLMLAKEVDSQRSNELLRIQIADSLLAKYNADQTDVADSYVDQQMAKRLKKGTAEYEFAYAQARGLSEAELMRSYAAGLGENYKIESDGEGGYTVKKSTGQGTWEVVGEEGSLDKETMLSAVTQDTLASDFMSKRLDLVYQREGKAIAAAIGGSGANRLSGETEEEYQHRLMSYATAYSSEQDKIDFSGMTREYVENMDFSGVTDASLKEALETAQAEYIRTYQTKNKQATEEFLAEQDTLEATELSNLLSANGMSHKDFENYTKGLEGFGIAARDVAEQALNISTGFKAIGKAYSDNLAALSLRDITNPEFVKAVGDVQDALMDFFGVDFGFDFVSSEENLDRIAAAMSGDVEAIKGLSIEAAKLSVEEGGFGEEIDKLLYDTDDSTNDLVTRVENGEFKTGQNMLSLQAEYGTEFDEILKEGGIAAERLDTMFKQLGFEVVYGENGTIDWGRSMYVGFEEGAKLLETQYAEMLEDMMKEIDPFFEINEILDDTRRELDLIAEAKDRAYGANKIRAMELEIDAQKKLIEQEKEHLKVYEKVLGQQAADMSQYGFVTDDTGRVTNYEEILTALAQSGSEEQFKAAKEAVEQYTETLNGYEDTQKEIISLNNDMFSMQLEKIDYTVTLHIELNDAEIKYLERQLSKLSDPLYDAADAINLMGDSLAYTIDNMDTYNQGVVETLAASFGNDTALAESILNSSTFDSSVFEGKELTEEQAEALRSYQDSMYETIESLESFYEQVGEKLTEAFDAMNEELDETVNKMEALIAVTDHYKNIIDLVGTKSLNVSMETLKALTKAQVTNAQAELKAAKSVLEANQTALAAAEEGLNDAIARGDEKAIKVFEEQVKNISAEVASSQDELYKAEEAALEAAGEAFKTNVQYAISAFEEASTGVYGTYERLQEIFEQQKEIGDRFVDDYRKIYELNKLNRAVTESIDETDSIKGKERLREIEQEINDLYNSNEEVTEHDLEYLQKKYELRLAEIALEEAQNAKSQVRMRRDAEGNWSYTYTADEEASKDAMQNYEDKLYELQDLEQNYIEEMQDRVLQAEIDLTEAINNIRREDFATDEEYQAEVTRLTKYYTQQREHYLNELNKALANSKDVYDNDWDAYNKLTGYKISADEKWVDSFEETQYAIMTGYDSIQDAQDLFKQNTVDMTADLVQAFKDWESNVQDTFKITDKEFVDFDKLVLETVDKTTGELDKVTASLEDIGTKSSSAFQKLAQGAAQNFTTYQNVLQNYITMADRLIARINEILKFNGSTITIDDEDIIDATQPPPTVTTTPGGSSTAGRYGDANGKYYATWTGMDGTQFRSAASWNDADVAAEWAKIFSQEYWDKAVYDVQVLGSASATQTAGVDDMLKQIEQGRTEHSEKYGSIETTDSTVGNYEAKSVSVKPTTTGQKELKGLYLSEADAKAKKNALTRWASYDSFKGFEFKTDNSGKFTSIKIHLAAGAGKAEYYVNPEDAVKIAETFKGSPNAETLLYLSKYVTVPVGAKATLVSKDDVPINACVYEQVYGGSIVPLFDYSEVEKGNADDNLGFKGTPTLEELLQVTEDSHKNDGSPEALRAGFMQSWTTIDEQDYEVLGVKMMDNGLPYYEVLAKEDKSGNERILYFPIGSLTKVGSYDTGGYTGSWDSSGRLAMLHQKEIVLNAHDTENFLAAINIVRDVVKAIDLQALAYENRLSGLAHAAAVNTNAQAFEQSVTIHAEFPNATNRSEIEAAFNSLVNRAAQFANRKI